jgi:transposase InsO family protein
MWVYFLKKKYEVFDHLKDFKRHVEKQYGKMIKNLHTNNGGEYVNKDVQHLCDQAGIQLQHIVPYISQQNRVDERRNQFLKDM